MAETASWQPLDPTLCQIAGTAWHGDTPGALLFCLFAFADSEREDGTAFAAQIAPSARGNASEKRQNSAGVWQSIGLVEPLFKREGDPVVQLVEQGGAVQRTLVPGAGGVELLNIARLGEVRAVMQIEGPTHIPPLRVGAKNARKRESQIDESTGGANRTLRGDHRSAAGVRAKNNGGSAIDRGNRRSAGETSNIIVV